MTFNEIRVRIKDDTYQPVYVNVPGRVSSDHIFDENQTVKWNREKAAAVNEARIRAMDENRKEEGLAYNLFRQDVISALQNEYDFSEDQAITIYNRAYESGHSEGYHKVVNEAEDLADFASEIMGN